MENLLGICKKAQEIYKTTAETLGKNFVEKRDFAILAVFAQACVDYEKFNEILRQDELTPNERYNTYNSRQIAKKDIFSASAKLGLNPADAKKIQLMFEQKEKDPAAEYLS